MWKMNGRRCDEAQAEVEILFIGGGLDIYALELSTQFAEQLTSALAYELTSLRAY